MLKRHSCDQVTVTTTWRKTTPSETKWRFFFFFHLYLLGQFVSFRHWLPWEKLSFIRFPKDGNPGKVSLFCLSLPRLTRPRLVLQTSIFLVKPAPNLFSTQVRVFPIDMITLCPPPTITNNDIYNLRHCERKISKDRACFTVRFIQHTQR